MLSDQEIMTRCFQGQSDLLDVLIERHATDLYTFCRRLCRGRSEADDLFQDCWLAVMRRGRQYDPQKPFRPWLFTVCLNLQRDRFRRARRWFKVLSGQQAEIQPPGRSEGDAAVEAVAAGEESARLDTALARLDETLRLPLLLHYLCAMPLAQIADIMRLAEGTVKSRLARGRERMRCLMEENEHGRS